MMLHLLTAVTRPENLRAIEASLAPAASYGIVPVWHKRFDPERQSVGGQSLKNAMIDEIADGWLYILDDDNLMHPQFWPNVQDAARNDIDLIVLTQVFQNGHIRPAHQGMLRSSHVDAGQMVIRRSALGDLRIPENYCGDGDLAETLGQTLRGRIGFVATPCCFYNALRAE